MENGTKYQVMTERIVRPYDIRLRADDGLVLRLENIEADQHGPARQAFVNIETGMLWAEIDELPGEFLRLVGI